MKKRFLSLLLVLVLIMSLMPAALAVNADDAQPKTISVTFRLHTDTDEWIAPTEVSDLPEGTSVFTVFQKVLADKGYTYEYHEQYCYVQAITAPDGTRLAEFGKGKNSGWLFRVNNDFADVGMNDFVLMDGDEIIGDIMHENVISINTLMDQEEVARQFKKYDFTAMPVVDNENRLVGIITVDDIVDIIEEETTEDMEKMAAIVPSDKPYMKTGVFETFKKRIPWLLLLMVSATFTGAIISSFEDALSVCAVLVAYIPMLMDTGGNAGSQASVTVIRGLSLNEIEYRDVPKVVFKEIRVALICGITLSAANFVKLLLLDKVGVLVAASVCLTLVAAVVIAMIIGCLLPILAKRLGFDPAVMASPFITTIVDAMSLLVYFRVASAILGL